ncbi:hypothetical protein OOK31_02225 [Streptomyces sp. NBC_00249]|nr:hypothetical protein [Streptomyces sp. NBC_00249]MCX5192716.1 hypothetical protein [Streptomyces sp. NBC_00249]
MDINWLGHDGATPLDIALTSGNTRLVEGLHAQGAWKASEIPLS